MVRALVQTFPHAVEVQDGDDRQRHWKLREMPVGIMRLRGAEELEAIESGITAFNAQADLRQPHALGNLRDWLMAALPPTAACVPPKRMLTRCAKRMASLHESATGPTLQSKIFMTTITMEVSNGRTFHVRFVRRAFGATHACSRFRRAALACSAQRGGAMPRHGNARLRQA